MTALGLGFVANASAQSVDWSGLGYFDYAYLIASPDDDAVGDNSFDYRRIYLTADTRLDDDFQMRVRLETKGSSEGRPTPFIKDAWLRWSYSEAGHRATLGVQPPPVYDITEGVWGYRSLEKTVMDRISVRDSRDFGLRLDGPLAAGGALQYSAMAANGNGVGTDPDGAPGKRLYGQVRYLPEGPFQAALGADYSDEDDLGAGLRVSALVGAVTERFHGGVEAFSLRLDPDVAGADTFERVGVSVFGGVTVAARTELVARYDLVRDELGPASALEHYGLGAVAYHPSPNVRLMPNVVVTRPEGVGASVLGRFTVEATF